MRDSNPGKAVTSRKLILRKWRWRCTGMGLAAAAFSAGYFLHQGQSSPTLRVNRPKPLVAVPVPEKNSGLVLAWNPNGPLGKILRNNSGGERGFAVARLVAETPVFDLEWYIDAAAGCPDEDFSRMVTDFAYAKWAADDPAAALAHALPSLRRYQPVTPRDLNDASLKGYVESHALTTQRQEKLKAWPVFNILGQWAVNDPQAALAAALKLEATELRQDAVGKVLETWVRGRDAAGALAEWRNVPHNSVAENEATLLFQRWSEVDPLAAFTHAGQINDDGQRTKAQNLILRNLAFSDPVKAVAILHGLSMMDQSTEAFRDEYLIWARLDREAALAGIERLTPGRMRTSALGGVYLGWAEVDAPAAFQAALELPTGEEHERAVAVTLPMLILQNAAAAGAYLAGLPAGTDRDQKVTSMVVGKWGDADPAAALAWLENNTSGPTHDTAVGDVLEKLAAGDPTGAIAYVTQLPESPLREKYLQSVLAVWGKQGPAGALAWVRQNLTGQAYDMALAEVLPLAIQANPAAMVDLVLQLPDGNARNRAVTTLAEALAAQDVPSALAWAKNLPDDLPNTTRNAAMQAVVKAWANADPARAAAFVEESGPGALGGFSVMNVAQTWAKEDPEAALAWAQSLPDDGSSFRQQAVAAVLAEMAANDPAVAWKLAVDNLASDPSASAFTSIVSRWGENDPVAVAKALAALPDGALGNHYTNIASFFVQDLMRADPEGAAEWVKNLPTGALRDAVVPKLDQMQRADALLKNAGGGGMTIMGGGVSISTFPRSTIGMGVPRDDGAAPMNVNVPLYPATSPGAPAGGPTKPAGQ